MISPLKAITIKALNTLPLEMSEQNNYAVFTIHLGKEITITKLLLTCFLVFIPSDMLSIAIASYLAKRLKPFANKH